MTTPSRKLRVGVVGTGYLGTFHAQKYAAMEGVDLAAVVDADPGKAGPLARKLGAAAYQRSEEIYDRVDAVSIAVPTCLHHRVALGFLRRGIHVLIEKPIAERIPEATELIRMAERKGCLLQVGHLERFNAVWKSADPALREPMFVEAHRLGPFQGRGTDVDVVLDLMIHDLDIVLKYVKSPVREVHAAGVPVLSGNVDIANVRLHFENGAVANLTASRVSLKRTRKIRFFQRDLYVSVDYDTGTTQIVRRSPGGADGRPEITGEEHVAADSDSLNAELCSFVRCVRTGAPPEVDGRQGRRALELALRILRRMRPYGPGQAPRWAGLVPPRRVRPDPAGRATGREGTLIVERDEVHGPRSRGGPPGGRILMIAGESSGDHHGARLVERILEQSPGTEIFGIGGDAMQRAGVRLLLHASRVTVMGLVEVVGRLPEIFRALGRIGRLLDEDPPDLVVLIDFPDFNLRVARKAARRRIPVLYYISPQIWAWRGGRIRQIARDVKHMMVIFPFEKALYDRFGVRATYVGHPLMDGEAAAGAAEGRAPVLRRLGLSPLYPVVGLFPGSRIAEVRSLLPDMLGAGTGLAARFPRMQFVLGEARELEPPVYDRILEGCPLPVKRVRTGIPSVVSGCDLALVASGTATLEVALAGVPMVVVYRVSRLTYLLGRWLIRVPAIGMVNLVPQMGLVPELIQDEVNPGRIVQHGLPFLTNAVYRTAVRRELLRTRDLLGGKGASERAARVVLDELAAAAGTAR